MKKSVSFYGLDLIYCLKAMWARLGLLPVVQLGGDRASGVDEVTGVLPLKGAIGTQPSSPLCSLTTGAVPLHHALPTTMFCLTISSKRASGSLMTKTSEPRS